MCYCDSGSSRKCANATIISGAKLNGRIYRALLQDETRKFVHLAPLKRTPDGAWADLAVVALDAGYSPADVARSVHRDSRVLRGSLSSYYEGRIKDWSRLTSHPDPGIREAARLGMQDAREGAARWAEVESQEELLEYHS